MNLYGMITTLLILFILFTGCSSLTPKEITHKRIQERMKVGKIYKVKTTRSEELIVEVKAVTETQVIGLRQTVEIKDITGIKEEVTDPPGSVVVTATTAFVIVPLTIIAVLLILVLI